MYALVVVSIIIFLSLVSISCNFVMFITHAYKCCVSNNSNGTSDFSALCLYNYAEWRLYTELYIRMYRNVLLLI